MKRTIQTIFILTVLTATAAFGQNAKLPTTNAVSPVEAITVALFDFSANTGKRPLRHDVTALITAKLSADPHLIMVERAQLQKAMSEQALGLSGNISFDAAAKVGQLTGAKVLISGRAIRTKNNVMILANIIGTETSRVMSQTVEGPLSNLVGLTSDLSEKIVQTIVNQSSNFVARVERSQKKQIDDIIEKVKDKKKPSVSINVQERIPKERGRHETTQSELGLIFQKAGFNVVDDKAERRPDVIITGSAVAGGDEKLGNLFSCRATVEVKVQERVSGKILSIDRQQSKAVDISKETALRLALENAADELAARLLPILAQ